MIGMKYDSNNVKQFYTIIHIVSIWR